MTRFNCEFLLSLVMNEVYDLHDLEISGEDLGRVDFFKNGHNLSSEDKRVINPSDTWAISLIKGILDNGGLEMLVNIGNSFFHLNFEHYMEVQNKVWFKKEIELLKQQYDQEPNSNQIIKDAERHLNMERYKLSYVLNFPYKVSFRMENYVTHKSEVDLFLADAELLHPYRYPYFTIIWANSILFKKD